MRPASPGRRRVTLRFLLVGWLLLAVPVQGWSSGVVGLLGAAHWHRAEARATVLRLDDFRRLDDYARPALARPPAHGHATLQRHHHAIGDASVLSFEGGSDAQAIGDAATTALSGAAGLLGALPAATATLVPPSLVGMADWRDGRPPAFASRDPERLERPPRA